MCGIVGYTGRQDATPVIIEGLKRLEYRGYDSAGVATISRRGAQIRRCAGKLRNLERIIDGSPLPGSIGIGHTRWATHGPPSERNAHPHRSGPVIVVHNGIIENQLELREELAALGHSFASDTDTEVIAHLIERKLRSEGDFERAVRLALREVRGTYALCILCEEEPGTLVAAKQGSPLVVGLGEGEYFLASDIAAILSHTREVVFLEDDEIVSCRDGAIEFSRIDGSATTKSSRHIEWSLDQAGKGSYPHFMLKEIHEQPAALKSTLAGRLDEAAGEVVLEGLTLTDRQLARLQRICLVACGTSWHAALVGKRLLEEACRLPVEVDIASEFRYRNPVVDAGTLLVLVSQSGETADTLAAMREGKRLGASTLAVCNVVDSSIAREADSVIYTHAGPEIGVASTKAFVTQLAALHLLAIRMGRSLGTMTKGRGQALIAALKRGPALLERTLELEPQVARIARSYGSARDFLFLGRGSNYPIALEGALKLKEISYVHAEGYAAGEMKHGPIALIDGNMPVVMLVPRDATFEKTFSNLEEVLARGGRVIALGSPGDEELRAKAQVVLEVPDEQEALLPVLLSVVLQLLAYHVAVYRGTDVDQPRNLAKSVTVE